MNTNVCLFQVKIGPWALESILKVVGVFNYFALHLKQLESFKPKYAWWKLSKWFWIFFNCDTCSIYFWYFTIISPRKNYCNTLKFHSPTNGLDIFSYWYLHLLFGKTGFLLNFYFTKGCFVPNINWHSGSEEEVKMRKVYWRADKKMVSKKNSGELNIYNAFIYFHISSPANVILCIIIIFFFFLYVSLPSTDFTHPIFILLQIKVSSRYRIMYSI